jgi:hypothetical protein
MLLDLDDLKNGRTQLSKSGFFSKWFAKAPGNATRNSSYLTKGSANRTTLYLRKGYLINIGDSVVPWEKKVVSLCWFSLGTCRRHVTEKEFNAIRVMQGALSVLVAAKNDRAAQVE